MDISTYWIVNFQIIFVILFSRFIVPLRKKVGVNRIITLKVNKYTSTGSCTGSCIGSSIWLEASVPKALRRRTEACNFIKKETLLVVFSCEFCEICKNTVFTKHFRTTASLCTRTPRASACDFFKTCNG